MRPSPSRSKRSRVPEPLNRRDTRAHRDIEVGGVERAFVGAQLEHTLDLVAVVEAGILREIGGGGGAASSTRSNSSGVRSARASVNERGRERDASTSNVMVDRTGAPAIEKRLPSSAASACVAGGDSTSSLLSATLTRHAISLVRLR
jgi:hypothetical protein